MFPRHPSHVLLTGILLSGLLSSSGLAQPADRSLRLTLDASVDDDGARVTLSFSRPVEYRFEESRGRLRLILSEVVDSADPAERSFESTVLRKYKVDMGEAETEIVFNLGRQFDTFTSEELSNPFRVVLQFLKAGIPPTNTPPGAPAPAPVQEPDSPSPATPVPQGRVIVIDPGHGGGEEGALGPGGLKEKDLVLSIAQKLRTRLKDAGFEPVLTRDADKAVDLANRTAEANHARAELLVSIHANASSRRGARGAETFFLSTSAAGDGEAASLAGLENMSGTGTADGQAGADAEIQLVLWEMAQAGHLAASSRLAELIQAEMNTLGDTRDRGVKQAPFRVLVGATMPAVLVEVGFLSNPDEEKRLATDEYQEQIAGALAAAIVRFAKDGAEGSSQ